MEMASSEVILQCSTLFLTFHKNVCGLLCWLLRPSEGEALALRIQRCHSEWEAWPDCEKGMFWIVLYRQNCVYAQRDTHLSLHVLIYTFYSYGMWGTDCAEGSGVLWCSLLSVEGVGLQSRGWSLSLALLLSVFPSIALRFTNIKSIM